MHIKSIVSDEDREELERMLSLGFIIPNQLFKTRQKSRMIIYIFTPVEFLLSINCYLSESYLMFGNRDWNLCGLCGLDYLVSNDW